MAGVERAACHEQAKRDAGRVLGSGRNVNQEPAHLDPPSRSCGPGHPDVARGRWEAARLPAGARQKPDDGPVDTALTGTITFLFTDLEGSTRRWEQFPQAMPAALGRHDAILRDRHRGQRRHRGQDHRRRDDGGVRRRDRCRTASLDAQRGADRRALGRDRPAARADGHPLRRGRAAGRRLLRDHRRTAPPGSWRPGTAARCCCRHRPASLAIELLPAGSGLRDLGEHHLRDLGRPEHLYQLVHPDLPADFPRWSPPASAGADLPVAGRGADRPDRRDRARSALASPTGPSGC